MMLDIGFMFSFGTLYVDIMSTFNTSRSEAALVQSILMAVRFGVGMIIGAVVQKFGSLYSGIVGSCLATTGLGLSYLAKSTLHLEFTMGIILAFGSSCLYISSAMAVGQHFSGKARHLLISVQSASGGVGGMIYPFLLQHLRDEYGFRGTLLIVGGVYLQILPFTLLWKTARNPASAGSSGKAQVNPRISDNIAAAKNQNLTQSTSLCEQPKNLDHIEQKLLSHLQTFTDTNDRGAVTRVSAGPSAALGTIVENKPAVYTTADWSVYKDSRPSDPESDSVRSRKSETGDDETKQTHLSDDSSSFNTVSTKRHDADDSEAESCEQMLSDVDSLSDDASVLIETLLTPSVSVSVSMRHLDTSKHFPKPSVNIKIDRQKSVIESSKESLWQSLKHLLCNPSFFLFAVGLGIAYPALGILFIFIVDLFLDAGFSQLDASLGLFLIHLFSIIGRLLPGIIMQWQRVASLAVPLIASITTASAMAGIVYVSDIKPALVLSAFIGIPYGMFVSVFSVTSLRLVGINRLSNALGVLFTVNGVGSALAGPVSGMLRDWTGSYRSPFLIAAGMVLVGGVLFSIALLIRRKNKPPMDERTPLIQR